MKEYPLCSKREQFEQWLRKTPDVRFWNTTDAMFAAFKAGLAQQAGGQVAEPSTVYVDVSGLTGTGKSAVAGEIEIAMRAIGLQVEWADGQAEKNMTGADWAHALEMYKPRVIIREKCISSATPAVEPKAESVRIDLDAATAAGEHAALGHLSRLVDEAADMLSQLRAMTDDMHKQWCNGGAPERGEFPLLDRVNDWLAARPTAQAEPVRVPVDVWLLAAGEDGKHSRLVVGWAALEKAWLDVHYFGVDHDNLDDQQRGTLAVLNDSDEWCHDQDGNRFSLHISYEGDWVSVTAVTDASALLTATAAQAKPQEGVA